MGTRPRDRNRVRTAHFQGESEARGAWGSGNVCRAPRAAPDGQRRLQGPTEARAWGRWCARVSTLPPEAGGW